MSGFWIEETQRMQWTLWMEENMTEGKFESKWQNMPDLSHHGGEVDQGPEKDIEEDQLRAEAEAAPGAPRDPGDPSPVLKVAQGSEAERKEDIAEVKVAPDQNPEKKDPEKADPNPGPGLRKKRIPELRVAVGPSREKTVDPSPSRSQNPDRENSEV